MRRDLAVCQHKRSQRDQAEAAGRLRAEGKPTENNLEFTKSLLGDQSVPTTIDLKDEDITMVDEPSLASGNDVKKGQADEPAKTGGTSKPSNTVLAETKEKLTAEPEQPKPPSLPPNNPEPAPATTTAEEPPQTSPVNSLFGKTPTPAGGQFNDADLDSMFDDLGKAESPGQGNLDFDSGDNNLDFGELEGQSHSLLPGLENYANIGEGEDGMDFMMSLEGGNNAEGNENNAIASLGNTAEGDGGAGQESSMVDTNYDDLFDFPTDFDGAGTGNVDDDDLMKLLND